MTQNGTFHCVISGDSRA